MCRVVGVTIDRPTLPGMTPEAQAASYERLLSIHLQRLGVWTHLPDERTDWDLEQLLEDIRTASLALRRLRGDADLPF